VSFDADSVRDEQAKVVLGIQPLTNEAVLAQSVRGQYGEGVLSGQRFRPTVPKEECFEILAQRPLWRSADDRQLALADVLSI